ncbi:LysR family transcriptional regulator [Vibrio kyushuensis]|uniref:LysR family transcriptional regulator n=1 Tax=Vibrio TaxID=662 RepID=UPI003D11DDBF
MNDKQLRNLDFNSLKLLKILGEELNTKRTAERMFISQPAVSKGLKKMRDYCGDEIFTRKQYGIEPTPFGKEVLRKLPLAFDVLDDIFSHAEQFDISNYTDEICIAISTSLYQPIAHKVYAHLRETIPNATIRLVNWGENTEHDLKVGKIHLGINYYPLEVSKALSQKKLSYAQFKLICRVGHPIFQSKGRLEDIGAYPLALLEQPDFATDKNLIERKLLAIGITPKVELKADQLNICLDAVKESDLLLPYADLPGVKLPEGVQFYSGHKDEQIGSDVGTFIATRSVNTPLIHWLSNELRFMFS